MFGCDGRLAELLDAPGDTFPRIFAYDAQGRLAFVGESNGVGNYEERYLYDDRGRLRVRGTAGEFSMRDLQWLDASGRIIRRSTGNDESDSTVHFVYGPAGVTTEYLHRNNSSFKEHGLTRYQYDRAGRLVLWWRATEREDCMIDQCSASSEAHRITYSCAGARTLEEIDRNRDGIADARTTWQARPDGTVEERSYDGAQFTGTKLYRFDCRSPDAATAARP